MSKAFGRIKHRNIIKVGILMHRRFS